MMPTCCALEVWQRTFRSRTFWLVDKSAGQPQLTGTAAARTRPLCHGVCPGDLHMPVAVVYWHGSCRNFILAPQRPAVAPHDAVLQGPGHGQVRAWATGTRAMVAREREREHQGQCCPGTPGPGPRAMVVKLGELAMVENAPGRPGPGPLEWMRCAFWLFVLRATEPHSEFEIANGGERKLVTLVEARPGRNAGRGGPSQSLRHPGITTPGLAL